MRAWGILAAVIFVLFLLNIDINANYKKSNTEEVIAGQRENPANAANPTLERLKLYASYEPEEKDSPSDMVKVSQISVEDGKVSIDLENPVIVSFADTNSMDPLIDADSNGIEVAPKTENDIHIGDIISYKPRFSDKVILHRVINISTDDLGTYFTLKGDNMIVEDPEKVRFNQIQRILVGIIY